MGRGEGSGTALLVSMGGGGRRAFCFQCFLGGGLALLLAGALVAGDFCGAGDLALGVLLGARDSALGFAVPGALAAAGLGGGRLTLPATVPFLPAAPTPPPPLLSALPLAKPLWMTPQPPSITQSSQDSMMMTEKGGSKGGGWCSWTSRPACCWAVARSTSEPVASMHSA
jgi:hypothetical protein